MSVTLAKNTLEFTTPYYTFEARNPNFKNIRFVPKIYVTRIDDKNVKIIVQIRFYTLGSKIAKVAGRVEYNEAVSDQEGYFRKLQNSNFSFGLPRPLVFLEKVIAAIQEFVKFFGPHANQPKITEEPVSVNAVPTSTTSVTTITSKYFTGYCNYPYYFTITFNYPLSPGTYSTEDTDVTPVAVDALTCEFLAKNGVPPPSITNFVFTPINGSAPINGYLDWKNGTISP